MPRSKSVEGQMLKNAAKLWHDSISASVPQCLRGAKFTVKESADRALQMKLRRRCQSRDGGPSITTTSTTRTPPPTTITAPIASASSLASDISNSTSSPVKYPPPKVPQIRKSSVGNKEAGRTRKSSHIMRRLHSRPQLHCSMQSRRRVVGVWVEGKWYKK